MLQEDEKPSFEEEALIGESGLATLENQLFGDVMCRKMTVSNTLSRGSLLPSNALTFDDVKSVLSRIEFAAYELSLKDMDPPTKLKELSVLAVKRINARKAASKEQAASSGNSATGTERPDEGINKASSSSAFILLGSATSRKGRPPDSKNRSSRSSPSSSSQSSPSASSKSSPAVSRKGSPSREADEPGTKTLVSPLASDSSSAAELQQKKPDPPALDGVALPGAQPQPDSPSAKTAGELDKFQTSTQQEGGMGAGGSTIPDAPASGSPGTAHQRRRRRRRKSG
jgi:hypothetical protein